MSRSSYKSYQNQRRPPDQTGSLLCVASIPVYRTFVKPGTAIGYTPSAFALMGGSASH